MRRSTIMTVFLVFSSSAFAQTLDGTLFDPGIEMTQPAESAPDELSQMQYLIGQWDVDYRAFRADTVYESGQGRASITFMNRGHAIMERWYCDACANDGLDLATMSFLAFNGSAGVWNLGTADAYKESISVLTGNMDDGVLELHNAIRHIGAAVLTYYKTTYRPAEDGFRVVTLHSKDYQTSWDTAWVREYQPRPYDPGFLSGETTYGSPAPNRPEESSEFDFLIGTFDAAQDLTLANGQEVSFPSTTTAVYALDGHAILEFGWYDVDPNLPDAATSIIRIYNRAMRRWESLYMANRGNGTLFFGGRKEGDEIVLGFFETDVSRGPIYRFVFHNIRDDGYDWYSASSTDRGETYTKTWIIDADRTEL